jgi:hypothetical protein
MREPYYDKRKSLSVEAIGLFGKQSWATLLPIASAASL